MPKYRVRQVLEVIQESEIEANNASEAVAKLKRSGGSYVVNASEESHITAKEIKEEQEWIPFMFQTE